MLIFETALALLKETWALTMEMAPYLLLGFLVAGLLRSVFNEDWVKRHLGQAGFYQILKAVVIGIPLPLCSCGVIPVAAAIRRQGGRPGAVAAFTTATPQTGVDAIAASVGLLGWPFTIVRIALAFINGIISGLIVDRLARPDSQSDAKTSSCCDSNEAPTTHSCCSTDSEPKENTVACCSEQKTQSSGCCSDKHQPPQKRSSLISGLEFGLITLPRDLFWALVIGLFLAGAISTLIPPDLFSAIPGGRFGTYLAMTLISLPLYVCSTGSIPMAFSFLAAGISPGAVLIFLIGGPATNTATVTALGSLLGTRATVGYIFSIIITAWLAAYALDASALSILVAKQIPHQHQDPSLFKLICAIALTFLLLFGRFRPSSK